MPRIPGGLLPVSTNFFSTPVTNPWNPEQALDLTTPGGPHRRHGLLTALDLVLVAIKQTQLEQFVTVILDHLWSFLCA